MYEEQKYAVIDKISPTPSRESFASNEDIISPSKLEISSISGIDERAFLIDVISYLNKRVKEKITGDESEKKIK